MKFAVDPLSIACCQCDRGPGQRCLDSRFNAPREQKNPHKARRWEARMLSCIVEHGSHNWTFEFFDWMLYHDDDIAPEKIAGDRVGCTWCDLSVRSRNITLTAEHRRQIDEIVARIEEYRVERQRKKQQLVLTDEVQEMAMVIAMVVRNEMEDFHVEHLTDREMAKLNPIIRNAVATGLHALRLAPMNEQAARFVGFALASVPPYWEPPELTEDYLKVLSTPW